jgi:hypothetical protein
VKKLLVVLCVLLLWVPALGAQSAAIRLGALDVAISNDFPLGPYQDISAWNLGASVRASLLLAGVPWLIPWVQIDNNYWLASPDWVNFGTQLNAVAGVGLETAVLELGGLGTLNVGVRLGYGLMFHIANATTTGDIPTTFAFYDQAISVSVPLILILADKNIGISLEPRYLLSPENNNIKQQLGVLLGLRIVLAGADGKGVAR